MPEAQILELNPYSRSTEELDYYYCQADASLVTPRNATGRKAQSYSAGGLMPFDEMASNDLHHALCEPLHRRAVQLRTNIEYTLLGLGSGTRAVLAEAFSPRRFDQFSTAKAGIPLRERQLRILLSVRRLEAAAADKSRVGNEERVPAACLVGLAVEGGIAARAFEQCLRGQRMGVHPDADAEMERTVECLIGTAREAAAATAARDAGLSATPDQPDWQGPSHSCLLLWMLCLAEITLQTDSAKTREKIGAARHVLSDIRVATGCLLMPALARYDAARIAREQALTDIRKDERIRQAAEWQGKHAEKERAKVDRRLRLAFGDDGVDALEALKGDCDAG